MTETELHKAIEHHYGSGVLMAFTDLIHEKREMSINCSKCGKDISETGAFGSDGFVCFDHPNCKPRTRTEYVKVTESIFDLKEEFERGELFGKDGEFYFCLQSTDKLGLAYYNDLVFRKVETPITEREEFIERFNGEVVDYFAFDTSHAAGKLYDAGCRFKKDKE